MQDLSFGFMIHRQLSQRVRDISILISVSFFPELILRFLSIFGGELILVQQMQSVYSSCMSAFVPEECVMETSLKLPHKGLSQREHQETHLYQLPHLTWNQNFSKGKEDSCCDFMPRVWPMEL